MTIIHDYFFTFEIKTVTKLRRCQQVYPGKEPFNSDSSIDNVVIFQSRKIPSYNCFKSCSLREEFLAIFQGGISCIFKEESLAFFREIYCIFREESLAFFREISCIFREESLAFFREISCKEFLAFLGRNLLLYREESLAFLGRNLLHFQEGTSLIFQGNLLHFVREITCFFEHQYHDGVLINSLKVHMPIKILVFTNSVGYNCFQIVCVFAEYDLFKPTTSIQNFRYID